MQFRRSAALATIVMGLGAVPAAAATCTLTVRGAPVIDDASCVVTPVRGGLTAAVEDGSAVRIRRRIMSARLADPSHPGRRDRVSSFGQVVMSDREDDKTCYFNQTAVLCIDR